MPDRPRPIARIRLARSLPRLLAGPLIVVLAGAAAATAGATSGGGPANLALVGLGTAVAIAALLAAVVLLSVGFEVAEAAVSLTWLGARRDYPLAPGPVTRVRLRGPAASKLRARFGALGWGIGRARLRGEEEIQLIRLASTATAILIPTERGRLAVAPANEDDLLEALAGAAQARQRAEAEGVAAQAAAEAAAPVAEVPPQPEPAREAEVPPASLTGIERALLEERLARERAEALAAAEAARVESEARGSGEPTEADAPPPKTDEMPPEPAARRRPALGSLMPRPSWGFVLLPTAGAGIAWWAGGLLGRPPEPGSDLARIVSLALVLAGPATSVGAIMALAWWPRLVGVVVTGGLVAVVFIGRALIGSN